MWMQIDAVFRYEQGGMLLSKGRSDIMTYVLERQSQPQRDALLVFKLLARQLKFTWCENKASSNK